MDLAGARRTRWAGIGDPSLPLAFAALIILGLVSATPGSGIACERATALKEITLIPLTAVMVERRDEALTVRLQTGRTPRYRAIVLDAPARIVIDLEGARYAWCGPLTTNPEPIREIRGSQWKPGTARVVVELSRPVGYFIEERSDGLVVRLEPIAEGQAEIVQVQPFPVAEAQGVEVAQVQPPSGAEGQGAEAAQVQPSPVVEGAAAAGLALKDSTPFKVIRKDFKLKGHVEVGYRGFLLDRGQGLTDDNVDLEGELDFIYDLSRALRLRLHPRVAIDPLEQARNRYEPYDAYLEYTAAAWSLLVGQLIESWSAVEMFSPADLLNRRDLERNFYDPEKLGELMARLRLSLPEGGGIRQPTFSLYVLPLFRRTPLPTNHDRFRFDITGDNVGDFSKNSVEPSFDVGFGARLTSTIGSADLSLFYYGGPGRIPSFALDPTSLAPRLMPVYYRADAVGASAQWALGPWVLKGETVYTFTSGAELPRRFKGVVPDSYFQYVVGVDRTFTDVLGKNEVTVTVEYSGEDNPRITSITGLRPFKSDLFLGARWQFHDPRRTEVRAFLAADVLKSEQLWLADFKTTVYGNLKLVLEGQFVNRGPSKAPDHLSVFGIFPNNTNIRVAVRYEF
jgi:AMIN domain-containing protein